MNSDEDYLDYDHLAGEDGEVTLRKAKIVTARKEHDCMALSGEPHKIKAGQRYRYERALVDGDTFMEYKICLNCIDKELGDEEE